MGLFGGGNSSSTSSNTTQNFDDRQVNTTTDSNNVFIDKSVKTDGGAIIGMAQVAKDSVSAAADQAIAAFGYTSANVNSGYQYADHIFDSAIGFANNVNATASNAYARAAQMSSDTLVNAQASYRDATSQVASAYADAKGTTSAQKQIILGVLAVAALFALAAFKHKG
jgi:hypothetical protein